MIARKRSSRDTLGPRLSIAIAVVVTMIVAGCSTPVWTLSAPHDLQRLPEYGGAITRVSATSTLVNQGPGSIRVLAFKPTVSTTINSSSGLPPFDIAQGKEVSLQLTGAIHDQARAVRRCTIVTSAGVGTVAFEVTPVLQR